ncbi:MAG: glutamine synthetase family protein [Nitratireductor sp.]
MSRKAILDWSEHLPESARIWLDGRVVEEVECIIGDFAGIARGKVMPARKFVDLERSFLPISIFYQTITGEYSDYDSEESWTETDMVLKPDLDTAVASPWAEDVTIQIIHDMETLSGEPVTIAPRYVLKKILAAYKRKGWKPVIAPELEFYLTKPNVDPDIPLEPPIGRSGRQGAGRQVYSIAAIDEYTAVIDTIYDYAEAQGLEIDTIIQEGGAGQIEINLNHGDPLLLADQVFTFKRTIREAALKHNCYATFMAKPMEGEPGSAMHLHMSVVNSRTGENVFSNEDGSPSDLFHHFIGGQATLSHQHHFAAGALYQFLSPPGAVFLRRSISNGVRTTAPPGSKLPDAGPAARRVESCRWHGYQSISVDGGMSCLWLSRDDRQDRTTRETFRQRLCPATCAPRELFQDCGRCRNSPSSGSCSAGFCRMYENIKMREFEDYLRVISPWEREHLLLNV